MSSLTAYVVETVVTLLAIVALAVLVLYGARRLGIGRPSGPLDLVGRLPLDGRRAIYLVRVGARLFVVGASEAGLSKLGEMDGTGVDVAVTPEPVSFSSALAKVLGPNRPAEKPAEGESENGEKDENAA